MGSFEEDPSTKVCYNYLMGFCPDGPQCKWVHVKSMIAPEDLKLSSIANFCQDENWVDHKVQIDSQYNRGPGGYSFQRPDNLVCYQCGGRDHKSTYCQEPHISIEEREQIPRDNH